MKMIHTDLLARRTTTARVAPWLCGFLLAALPNAAQSQILNNITSRVANPVPTVDLAGRLAAPTLTVRPTAIQPVLPNAVLTTLGIPSNSLPTVDASRLAPVIAMPEITNTLRRQVGVATAETSGLGRLVAPGSGDSSVVVARIGSTVRANASSLTADFDGDGLINFEIAPGAIDLAATAGELGSNAVNGLIGQHVTMATGVADRVLDGVINVEGIVAATTFEISNGTVVLGAVLPSGTVGQVGVVPTPDESAARDPNGGAGQVRDQANGSNNPETGRVGEVNDPTTGGCGDQVCDPDDPQPDPSAGPLPELPIDYSQHLRPALADLDFSSEPGDLLDVSIMLPLRGREREGDLYSNYGNEEIW